MKFLLAVLMIFSNFAVIQTSTCLLGKNIPTYNINLTNNYHNGKRLQISPSGNGDHDKGGN